METQENLRVGVISHASAGRQISWLPKGGIWAEPGIERLIDYEPISCASRYQLACAKADLNDGSVELVLHVRAVDGSTHDIRYNPFKRFDSPAEESTPKTVARAPQEDPAELSKRHIEDDDERHTIKVAAGDTASYLGIASEPVRPPVSSGGVGEATGFTKAVPAAAGISTDDILRPKAKPEEKDPYAAARKEFEALVAVKDWSGAHRILVSTFGDKVDFTYRVVVSLKSWDAIVEKYKLI